MMGVRDAISKVDRFSPWMTLGILITFALILPTRVYEADAAAKRQETVAAALGAAPFFVGEWIGEDSALPQEAQELLRLNGSLSRTYRQPGGMQLHVLVVHCSDARDMIGHYPPICYPSSGWVRLPAPGDDLVLNLSKGEIPVRVYRFRRAMENGTDETIRILSSFILPDGSATPNRDEINRRSERLALSVQGVAQVQIISSDDLPLSDVAEATVELLEGMPEVLGALGIGQGASS